MDRAGFLVSSHPDRKVDALCFQELIIGLHSGQAGGWKQAATCKLEFWFTCASALPPPPSEKMLL